MSTNRPSDDDSTTTTDTRLLCPVCWNRVHRVGRQRFCSDNCRKTAWARSRQAQPTAAEPVPPPHRRRDITVYACPGCDSRYYAQQWCDDCNRPCTRIGFGGLCPHCDEPVAVTDLLDTPTPATLTTQVTSAPPRVGNFDEQPRGSSPSVISEAIARHAGARQWRGTTHGVQVANDSAGSLPADVLDGDAV